MSAENPKSPKKTVQFDPSAKPPSDLSPDRTLQAKTGKATSDQQLDFAAEIAKEFPVGLFDRGTQDNTKENRSEHYTLSNRISHVTPKVETPPISMGGSNLAQKRLAASRAKAAAAAPEGGASRA